MKQYVPIVLTVLLLLGIAACAPAAPAVQEATPTQQESSPEPYHPLTTRTGIETIDRVLEAVERGDIEGMRAQVEFLTAPCTKLEGFGGPPKCREGEAEGTPVEALAFLGSEGGHLRRDEIENWLWMDVSSLYAVYEVNTAAISSEQYYPIGKYVILLVTRENGPAIAQRIGERGIVCVDYIFDSSPASLAALVEREALSVILPPKS